MSDKDKKKTITSGSQQHQKTSTPYEISLNMTTVQSKFSGVHTYIEHSKLACVFLAKNSSCKINAVFLQVFAKNFPQIGERKYRFYDAFLTNCLKEQTIHQLFKPQLPKVKDTLPRLFCTLIRKSQASCKIYPIFFKVAKAPEIFQGMAPIFFRVIVILKEKKQPGLFSF